MEKRNKILFSIICVAILFSVFIIYAAPHSNSNDNTTDKIIVAASIMPQKEFIERVGGDKVDVLIMVPQGADPHTYEMEPSKLREVSKADIYMEVGSGIEFELTWMNKLKSINPSMTVVNSSKGIAFISDDENSQSTNDSKTNGSSTLETKTDPHVWTSPKNAMIMVENTYQALVKIDPDNKDYYLKNKAEYLNELKQLDQDISSKLNKRNNTNILVYHPSWAYFCKDYGLKEIAIEKEGKEPSPQTISNIIDQARKDNIKVVFVSPQFSTRNANTIAQEIGAKVVIIDPLSPNYIQNMKNVLNALNALK